MQVPASSMMRSMTDSVITTRFAPSPSGRLHLGNLRTALFNVLLARRQAGRFLLRIEDSDSERSQPEAIAGVAEDLRWLGLEWDLGPGIGESGDWQQSARKSVYLAYAEQLLAADAAYWCFCSNDRLSALRAEQSRSGQAPRYDGHCAGIDPDEAKARRAAGETAVLRLRMPRSGWLEFEDLVRGPQRIPADALGDPVLMRSDGTAAFLFANALDDALMGVTHVLRGEDHLSNTPRQQVLLSRLGLKAPSYGHLALVIEASGAPLSKRTGSAGLEQLRAAGYRPEAVINYLARLGNPGLDEELKELQALADGFDPSRLTRSPARFDPAQLDHWQSLAMANAPVESLLPALSPGQVPVGQEHAFVEQVKPNLRFAHELNDWAERLFAEHLDIPPEQRAPLCAAGAEFYHRVDQALAEASGSIDWSVWRPKLEEVTGCRGGKMMKPLRIALTALSHGPALGALIDLMPPAIRHARLVAAARIAEEAADA